MRRYAKLIIIPITNVIGEKEELYWCIHLSSTGWILPHNDIAKSERDPDPIHQNFIHKIVPHGVRAHIEFSEGGLYEFHDNRTWSRWYLYTKDQLDEYIKQTYGPDWLLNPAEAGEALIRSRSNRRIKEVLLDQKIACGIGNYLVCEILYRHRTHPYTPYGQIDPANRRRLVQIVHETIRDSLESDDHSHWNVFTRRGQPCPSCRTPVSYSKDTKNGQRGSYFCEICQPPVAA